MAELRGFKKSYSIISVVYIVFGVVLLIWPDISMHTFCYILGIGGIIFGVVHIVTYFTKEKMLSLMQIDLTVGIVSVCAGLFVLMKPALMISLLPFIVGVALILGAVIKLQNSLELRKLVVNKWWIMLLVSIVMFMAGVAMVINPFETAALMLMLMGICMLTDGIINLASMFLITGISRKMQRQFKRSEKAEAMNDDMAEIVEMPKKI